MDDIIIKHGKAVEPLEVSAAVPLGVEYERLMKNLRKNVEDRHNNRTDLRQPKQYSLDMLDANQGKPDEKKTFILQPGMLINPENSQSDTRPYPSSDIPSTQGLPWSDNF